MNQLAVANSQKSDSDFETWASTAYPQPQRSYFDPDMVVTRDASGNPLSHYGDFSWNLSGQSTDGTTCSNLYFFAAEGRNDPELALRIGEQHRALIWLHSDAGKFKSRGTIQGSNYALAAWCDKAYARRLDLFKLLTSPELVSEECTTLNDSYLSLTSSLITTLWRHRSELNLDFVPLDKLKSQISKELNDRPDFRQTPLIPSRIYCAILGSLIAALDIIERDLSVLLQAYRQSVAASNAAPANGSPMERKLFRAKVLQSVAERMRAFGYVPRRGGALDNFIANRINRCQTILMHALAAFTGMRIGELAILPLHGVIETFEDKGSIHYEVKGYSYKLNRGVKKPASWITSIEGYRAILLAQQIASTIADVLGKRPKRGQEALLFPSTVSPFRRKSSQHILNYQTELIEAICPIISQDDIDDLNRLELDREWQHAGIDVGKPWNLTFHQLRRSLSVYAHRSGMVTLPALKAQLQHITDEMRTYYSDGYSRAVNLVFDKDHFSHEWNAARSESSYFGYILGALFSEDEILGRGAERMAGVLLTHDREQTLRLFREGKLAYKETVLGGCTSVDECALTPQDSISLECLKKDCANQIVVAKRLAHVVRTQEIVVATLERDDRGSVEHRLEVGQLHELLKARQRLTGHVQ